MLEVYLDINYENKIKANENLYNFVNIFVADLECGIEYEFIFPSFLYQEDPSKCKEVLKDLDLWINDSFTHHLPALHQYVLYNILETWIKWNEEDEKSELLDRKDAEDKSFNTKESTQLSLLDIEEIETEEDENITDDEWVKNYPNDLELLRTLFLADFDFLYIGELYETFKKAPKELRSIYFVYIEEYKDLMPKDIRLEFEVFKNSISDETFLNITSKPLDLNKDENFLNIINVVVNEFRRLITEEGLYKLLWNDDHSPKQEVASQLLFKAFSEPLLKKYNIDISREVETGRGPVDFKLSHGYNLRLLIEVKLASNSSFWLGLKKQLIQYMISEKVTTAIFLVVIFDKKDFKLLENIDTVINDLNKQYNLKISIKTIDATKPKPSASNLGKDYEFEIYYKK